MKIANKIGRNEIASFWKLLRKPVRCTYCGQWIKKYPKETVIKHTLTGKELCE